MDLMSLLRTLAVPRPNGSQAAGNAADLIARTLAPGGAVARETFFLRPHLAPLVGLALALLAAGVAVALIKRRNFLGLILALSIPVVYLAEFEYNLPLVSRLGGRTGENITAVYGPRAAERILVFTAHYDTKTELFDHEQRKPIYAAAPLAMIVLLTAGAMAAAGKYHSILARRPIRALQIFLAILGAAGLSLLAVSFGGGYFALDKSPGARDDGTSVAILLGLAERLAAGTFDAGDLQVRLVFFAGEEANMQGSRAYVARHRDELGRAILVNLECLAGPGSYRCYERSGTFLRKFKADDDLRILLDRALSARGLPPADPGGSVFDDSASFAAAGVPVITIYNEIPGRPDSYHNAGDDLSRVVPGRMEEIVGVLGEMVEGYAEAL